MPVVLIPAFEPDRRLVELVRALAPWHPVLVVDDGSGPGYAEVFAAAASAGALVAGHVRNRGKGAALRTGFALAAAEWPGLDVVTADADGQHTPADIARVAAALEQTSLVAASARGTRQRVPSHEARAGAGRDQVALVAGSSRGIRHQLPPEPVDAERRSIVLGTRAFTGTVPARSRVGNALTRTAFRLATGQDVRDTQTGLRGFPAELLPWLQTITGDRFEYEFRMLLAAPAAGIALVEVPIETVYLDSNASSHFRPLADSARIWAPLVRFSASAVLAFVVDTTLLLVLQALTGWLLLSIVAARIVSAGMNFAINREYVFGAGRSIPIRTAAARYFSLAALLLTASFGMLTALTDAGMATLPAKLLTDGALFIVSYSVQRAVVFAPLPGDAPGQVPGHGRE
ncbi:MAG: bifunctional glycosyltransferase family 2/GtrA family protein [Microbacterium sp.]